PLPQVTRIRAAKRRKRRERLDKTRLRTAIAPDDVAMKVVARFVRGPFVADESGKTPWIIGFIGGLDDLAPGAAIGWRSRRGEALRHLVPAETGDNIDRCLSAFS